MTTAVTATLRRIALEPANLVRYARELTVQGLAAFRASIGLDAGAPVP